MCRNWCPARIKVLVHVLFLHGMPVRQTLHEMTSPDKAICCVFADFYVNFTSVVALSSDTFTMDIVHPCGDIHVGDLVTVRPFHSPGGAEYDLWAPCIPSDRVL